MRNERRPSPPEIYATMSSVLEAIRQGDWDYEPQCVDPTTYSWTGALPGSPEKVEELARRAASGLPLWHPRDCRWYAENSSEA